MKQDIILEHANITVASIEEAVRFLSVAFPTFKRRGTGYIHDNASLGSWLHFGTDNTYLALQENKQASPKTDTTYQNDGINHIGFVVDDIENLVGEMASAGYKPTGPGIYAESAHRKRAYFFDGNGFEWEFIEYHSEVAAERNTY